MLANMDDNASKRISLEKVADRYLNGFGIRKTYGIVMQNISA